MITFFFKLIAQLDDFLWNWLVYICISFALYMCVYKRFAHFKLLGWKHFVDTFFSKTTNIDDGKISPLKLFMVSVGGMVGVGNLVGVIIAITLGGPGALLWVWVAAIFGVILKYSEVYLGVLYRKNENGKIKSGPMYFLEEAFTCNKNSNIWLQKIALICRKILPKIVAMLLIIYGVEIYIFLVINDSIVNTIGVNKILITFLLLGLTFYAIIGGVKRVANICSVIVPIMVVAYIMICLYIIFNYYHNLCTVIQDVFYCAFIGKSAIGGFAGATTSMVIKHGVSRTVYSTDIALGFDSSVSGQTSANDPYEQAKLSIWAMFVDIIFCTMSIIVVLITGVWQFDMPESQYVTKGLNTVIDGIYVHYFMMFFIFTTGWTTILSWLVVANGASSYLFGSRWTKRLFFIYAGVIFSVFSFAKASQVYHIVSICSAILLVINSIGIFILRDKIKFVPKPKETEN